MGSREHPSREQGERIRNQSFVSGISLNGISWEQLARYPMIVNIRSPQHNKTVQAHFLKFGQTLKVDYEVREDSTILSMVKQGLGAAVMARLAAEPIPEPI